MRSIRRQDSCDVEALRNAHGSKVLGIQLDSRNGTQFRDSCQLPGPCVTPSLTPSWVAKVHFRAMRAWKQPKSQNPARDFERSHGHSEALQNGCVPRAGMRRLRGSPIEPPHVAALSPPVIPGSVACPLSTENVSRLRAGSHL